MRTLLIGWNVDWQTAPQKQNIRNRPPHEGLMLVAQESVTDHRLKNVVTSQAVDPLRKTTDIKEMGPTTITETKESSISSRYPNHFLHRNIAASSPPRDRTHHR